MPNVLLDDSVPLDQRRRLLAELCNSGSKEAGKMLDGFFKAAAAGRSEDLFAQKKKELDELIDALEAGPQRPGLFFGHLPANGSAVKRAQVRLQDGTATYPVLIEDKLPGPLDRGDGVLLSARGEAILAVDPFGEGAGEEARLIDHLDDRVEVSLRSGDERHLLYASGALRRRLEAGEVTAGSALLVCLRRQIALDVIPRPTDEWAGYRYLAREEVPDVIAERDIGDPPAFIGEAVEFCRREMVAAPLRRKYRLRRCRTYLLSGASGTGKTLSVCACIRGICNAMAEVTGVAVGDLPPRVIRLRMSKLLSMWLGESDRHADQLVDEIERLADRKVTGPRGTFEVPVIVVLEELDGIARRRGGDLDGVYDRIQTTLLQRLDHTSNRALRDRLIVMFATTNVPHLIDPAWARRVGGQTIAFGRLGRRAFAAVLDKHLRDIPIAGAGGNGHAGGARGGLIRQVTSAVYDADGSNPGLLEIQLAGATAPVVKGRRDLMTGAIVDRAVQRAADHACGAEEAGCGDPGLSVRLLLAALDEQVDALASSLGPANAADFVNLPDGARVTAVRRLARPSVQAVDLQRRWS
jgi:ATP-dependent 26S proteasome regulatory subunit